MDHSIQRWGAQNLAFFTNNYCVEWISQSNYFVDSMLFGRARWAVFSDTVKIFFGQRWHEPPRKKLAHMSMESVYSWDSWVVFVCWNVESDVYSPVDGVQDNNVQRKWFLLMCVHANLLIELILGNILWFFVTFLSLVLWLVGQPSAAVWQCVP